MQQEPQEAKMEIQSRNDGGKSIVIRRNDGTEQRIELSNSGDVITSSVQGEAVTVAPPPPPPPSRRKELPGGLVELVAIVCSMVAISSIFTPVAKAWARRFEKRAELQSQQAIAQRLGAIEQAIETVAVEVERISEGQRFTAKLLAERAPAEMERVR